MAKANFDVGDSRSRELPEEIRVALTAMIRRVRRNVLLKGVLAVAAVALGSVLAVMAVDASFTILSRPLRWALSLGALGATLAAVWHFLLRPLTRRISLAAIARAVELKHPDLHERVSTAVELAGGPGGAGHSEELLALVVGGAVRDVEGMSPEREFTTGAARPYKVAAGVAVGVLGLLFVIWPGPSARLLARAVAPFADIGNAFSGKILSITGDLTVAKGDPVTIEVEVDDPTVDAADLLTTPDGAGAGAELVERMRRAPAGPEGARRFVFEFPAVSDGFRYRVHAGKVVSQEFRVDALDRPAVRRLEISYRYPAYTGLAPSVAPEGQVAIEAVAGTEVTVQATLNRPVEAVRMSVSGNELVAPEMSPAGAGDDPAQVAWRFPLTAGMDGLWRIDFSDSHGLRGSEGNHPVRGLSDGAPSVRIVSPVERELKLPPTDSVPLVYEITEDFGVASVAAVVDPDRGDDVEVQLDAPPPGGAEWSGRGTLTLSRVAPPSARTLRVRVRVRDNYPAELGGPHEAWSETLVIRLDQGSRTLFEQTVAAVGQELKKEIRDTMSDVRDARWRAEDSRNRLRDREEVDPDTLKRLEETKAKAQSASDRIEELAAEMAQSPFARGAEALREVAEDHTRPAAQAASEIPLSDDASERVAAAESAIDHLEDALEELEDAVEALHRAPSELRVASELDRLAQRQQRLADQAQRSVVSEQTPPAGNPGTGAEPPMGAEKQREWQQDQERVAREAERLAAERADNPEKAAALARQSELAAALAERAGQLAGSEQVVADLLGELGAADGGEPAGSPGQKAGPPPDDPAATGPAEPRRGGVMEALQAEQSAIAEETRAFAEAAGAGILPDPGTDSDTDTDLDTAPEPLRADLGSASEAAGEAAEHLDAAAIAGAAEAAAEAAAALERASRGEGLPEFAPAPAEAGADAGARLLAPPSRAALEALADRQETVAAALGALAVATEPAEPGNAGDGEAAALAAMQESMARQAAEMAGETGALGQAAGQTGVPSAQVMAQALGRASGDLTSGARRASSSSRSIASGEPAPPEEGLPSPPGAAPGAPAAQAAQQSFADAAEALAVAADVLGAQSAGLAGEAEALASGASAAQEAAEAAGAQPGSETQQPQSGSMGQSAEAAQQAANSFAQAALSAMQAMGVPSEFMPGSSQLAGSPEPGTRPGQQPGQQPGQEPGQGEGEGEGAEPGELRAQANQGYGPVPEGLAELGISADDWVRIQGAARSAVGEGGVTSVPAEYRELVRGYFEALVKGGGDGE